MSGLPERLAVEASAVTPGLLGFVVVALLGVATYLLIRSMNRQIRRIDLPEEPEPPTREGEGPPTRDGDAPGGAGAAPR